MGFWKEDKETWREALSKLFIAFREAGFVRTLEAIFLLLPLAVLSKICLGLSRRFESFHQWFDELFLKV